MRDGESLILFLGGFATQQVVLVRIPVSRVHPKVAHVVSLPRGGLANEYPAFAVSRILSLGRCGQSLFRGRVRDGVPFPRVTVLHPFPALARAEIGISVV